MTISEPAATIAPAEVWPLAFFLYEEFKERGWRTEDAVVRFGGQSDVECSVNLCALDLCMVVHRDKLLIGDKLFAGLARALDVSVEYLENLDAAWRNNPSARVEWECPDDIFGPISRRSLIRLAP